ncbi:MAG: exosortase [Kiritimatiellae bacterium]|nr:exosortase [Kiritimatiellia bacterium]
MKVRSIHVVTALLAAVFAAMLWGFQAMLLHHAPDMFRAPQEDMSFGWYVPLFSLYVVWAERKKIVASLSGPSWAGLLATLPFLALGFLGVRGVQLRFEIVAFVGLLITVPWAFFGKETAKAVLFPALFLLFCIPLATFLDVVTVHLRLFASSTAFAVARGVGADIVQQGTMVGAADGSFAIDVADPCSGLRSLFALMALTAGYAYFTQPTWLRRGILFAASVPIAILGNVMRILTIVLVANFASSDFATGFYHDYSGFVVFAVAIVLMVLTGEGITRVFELKVKSCELGDETSGVRPRRQRHGGLTPWSSSLAPILTFALVVPLMFFQAATPDVAVAEAPNVHLAEIAGFSSEVLEPSEAELTVLPSDTVIEKRRYVADNGDWMVVSLVVGGKSKSSIHRPELCLPAQGLRMVNPRTRSVAGRDWRFIDLSSKDSPTFGFAYTFFNQEGFKTASHVSRIFRDVLDRSVLNRIDRWAMVTVNASRSDDAGISLLLSRIELDGGNSK